MKKRLLLILRILFAVAGVVYIGYSITWTDTVIVPPGTYQVAAQKFTLTHDTRFAAGGVDPNHPTGGIMIDNEQVWLENGLGKSQEWIIDASQLGHEPGTFRLKPGIPTMLLHSNKLLLLIGLLLVAPVYPIQTYRWLLLLRARGMDVSYSRAFKLTMVGCFFNYCMPGTTGGDVIKAYYAARRSERRADAVMSVFFDRVVGLLGLILLAGIAGLTMLQDPVARKVTLYIWLIAAAIVLFSAVYFSSRLRKKSGLDWLINRLFKEDSMVAKIDRAAYAYREHKGAVIVTILLSLPVHLMLATATALAGYALGMRSPFGLLLTVIPVLFLSGSIPISPPQGIGVMEWLGARLLEHPPIATFNQIAGMLILIRLYQVVYSLIGALYLLQGDVHMHPEREADTTAVATQPA